MTVKSILRGDHICRHLSIVGRSKTISNPKTRLDFLLRRLAEPVYDDDKGKVIVEPWDADLARRKDSERD
jgi:hypothetical protein